MTKHHRFTGRELTALLEQVREELGAEATIVEANKVRTGGIAGFFANERFEVIATPSDDQTIELGLQLDLVEPSIAGGVAHDLVSSADERDTVDIRSAGINGAATAVRSTAQRTPLSAQASGSTEDGTTRPAGHSTSSALLDRADTISITDRIGLSRPPADRSTKAPPPPERRFGDILSSELSSPEISVRTSATEDFWTHLEELEDEVEPLDLDSRIVVVVGNRRSAIDVARRLETTTDDEVPALVALSPEPAELGLPAWQQVDDEIQLGDRLRFWANAERQGIVVIDAEFGADATALVERVRRAGSRVVRMVVDDELSPKRIFDLMQRIGGNVVVDLSFPADPAYVLSLVDRGVPLATIDGHTVDANLLLALNREVQHG